MAQQAANVLDMAITCQDNLGKMKMTIAASDLQEHVAFNALLRKKRIEFSGGSNLQWNVMTKHSGAAAVTGLFAIEDVAYESVLQTAAVPWRHTRTYFMIDERMVAMNRTPNKVLDEYKKGRVNAIISYAELMEQKTWEDTPAANTDDPLGVPYYIVRNASAGFNGGNPTYASSAGAGSLDSATYTRWRNYTDRYTNITKADLVRRWRKAATLTQFRNPVGVNHASYDTGDDKGYYTNYDVVGTLEEVLEDQNQSLGNDIASKDGRTLFRGRPVTHVPYLDSAAGQAAKDPVYGINWGEFKVGILSGEWMNELKPIRLPSSPRVIVIWTFCTHNLICYNRRKQFIIDKA